MGRKSVPMLVGVVGRVSKPPGWPCTKPNDTPALDESVFARSMFTSPDLFRHSHSPNDESKMPLPVFLQLPTSALSAALHVAFPLSALYLEVPFR